MKSVITIIKILLIGTTISFTSCKKQDRFLDAVPEANLKTPTSLDNLQLLLQNDRTMNNDFASMGQMSSDDFYTLYSIYLAQSTTYKNIYIWASNPYPNLPVADWTFGYQRIFYANKVLDNLTSIDKTSSNQSQYNSIQGSAYFFRAISFYDLMQIFARVYDSKTASTDLGIPLRLHANISEIVKRSTVQQCYDQIISDLQNSINLLSDKSNYQTLPSKNCAYAFLSRVYLSMGDYKNTLQYANTSLGINNTLTDFNTLIPTPELITTVQQFPLSESLYVTDMVYGGFLSISRGIADTTLVASYDQNDLRKTFFFQNFNGYTRYFGSYDVKTGQTFYNAVANDEVYLNKAESEARLGNVSDAMNDLNTLLAKRYKTGTYILRTASSPDEALRQILIERRKELCFRGTRWTDLRRLNLDPKYQVTLTRYLNGTTYTLPPNDLRYVLLIPDDEIHLSGIPQNPR